MKHDDICDENYRLMREYRATRKWRFLKRRRLRAEIICRWYRFVREICSEHSESSLPWWMREENSIVPACGDGSLCYDGGEAWVWR